MASTRLTCAQTPLAWPTSVAITDLPVCTGCAIQIDAPHPGSLQVTTRRAGDGVGDGVNVDEARNSVAVDYRGQRYTLMEAIFHTPGQHVFPGQSDVYPAEYCLHFQTFASPQRALTLIVPVSHQVTGPGADYFAAIKAQPDPAATRPTLLSLFGSPTIDTVQFLGPDLRGRTSAVPVPTEGDTCSPHAMENMMALVLQPCQIRATDLERIPREGSLSSDPRDLPAQPRLQPSESVSRATLQAVAVLARPGLQVGSGGSNLATGTGTQTPPELECYPLEVRSGKDVIAVDGSGVPIETVLGLGRSTDVSGAPAGLGGVLGSIFVDPTAPPDQQQAAQKLQTQVVGVLTIFLWGMAVWFLLRQLLFTESTTAPPILSNLTWVGVLTVLAATGIGSSLIN
jgi:hypothetical protein